MRLSPPPPPPRSDLTSPLNEAMAKGGVDDIIISDHNKQSSRYEYLFML